MYMMSYGTEPTTAVPIAASMRWAARHLANGASDATLDKVKAAAFLATDRVHVLRQAIMCCRKAGTVSIIRRVCRHGGQIPLGAAMNKGLTFKTGQTHVQAYAKAAPEKDH